MKRKYLSLDERYTIYVIGDIHGNFKMLKKAVEKMDLNPDDHLVIIGDVINRGPNSLESLDYVVELAENNKNVHVLMGNHELFTMKGLFEEQERFYSFYKDGKYTTIAHELIEKENVEINDENHLEVFKLITDKYAYYFDFIKNLPIVLETDEHVFVHAAYKYGVEPKEDPYAFLKDDYFFDDKTIHEKKVIVGHMPSGIFDTTKFTSKPFYDDFCNRIFIDGGCGVKTTGEINTLVITKNDEIIYTHDQTNVFEKYVIRDPYYFENREAVVIRYPNFEIEVLEEGEEFSLCKYKHNEQECLIFNDFIREFQGVVMCWYEYTDKRLNLEAGEIVEFVASHNDMAFVKYNEEFGWIYLDQIMGD
jgi:predicted phosphodiesterase